MPGRGDLVWLEFTPQTGREQAGRRPALVVSPKSHGGKVGLVFLPNFLREDALIEYANPALTVYSLLRQIWLCCNSWAGEW